MLCVPVAISESEFVVFLVIEDENIERLKEHDPSHLELDKLGLPWSGMKLHHLTFLYATPEEAKAVASTKSKEQMRDLLRNLSRGFRYRPELGDSDGPYQNIASQ
jgi:hypothetical protein